MAHGSKRFAASMVAVVAVVACGCFVTAPPQNGGVVAAIGPPDRVYEVAPDKVQKAVVDVLKADGFDIQAESDGSVTTAYKTYAGQTSGVWKMKTRWEERLKLHIDLYRHVRDARTLLFVNTYNEERPNPNYTWRMILPSDSAMVIQNGVLRKLDVLMREGN